MIGVDKKKMRGMHSRLDHLHGRTTPKPPVIGPKLALFLKKYVTLPLEQKRRFWVQALEDKRWKWRCHMRREILRQLEEMAWYAMQPVRAVGCAVVLLAYIIHTRNNNNNNTFIHFSHRSHGARTLNPSFL